MYFLCHLISIEKSNPCKLKWLDKWKEMNHVNMTNASYRRHLRGERKAKNPLLAVLKAWWGHKRNSTVLAPGLQPSLSLLPCCSQVQTHSHKHGRRWWRYCVRLWEHVVIFFFSPRDTSANGFFVASVLEKQMCKFPFFFSPQRRVEWFTRRCCCLSFITTDQLRRNVFP